MTKLYLEEFNELLLITLLTTLLQKENIKTTVEDTMVGYKVRRLILCTAYEIKKRESNGFLGFILDRLFGKEYLKIIPLALMGYESIAIDSRPMRASGIIVLVKSN